MTRVIVLSDGPHNIAPPTMRSLRDLQVKGYAISKQFSPLTLITGDGADAEWDLTALADHIAATMNDPAWDTERVTDAMLLDECANYYAALRALAEEAFGEPDPKASNPDSPE